MFGVCSAQLTDGVKDDHYSTYEYEHEYQNGWQDDESYSSLVFLTYYFDQHNVEVC